LAPIYITGHRHPDTDSIASAIGYAELKRRLDAANDYVPVRLGELNAQTTWVRARAGPGAGLPPARPPARGDVMRTDFPVASQDEPVRRVTMARQGLDLVPIVDGDGALTGVMTERALARRYIRESREVSRLEIPTAVEAIVDVLDGTLVSGEDSEVTGRVWVLAMDAASLPIELGSWRSRGRRRPPGCSAARPRAGRRAAGHEQLDHAVRGAGRAGARAGDRDHLLRPGQPMSAPG
jgi:manganese-dependent inorganic pyrophosphatase